MAQNPLLGSKISLVSKKNIRYEGTLYSINESDATVALQNVKSYGTEGREKTDEGCTFVPPQDHVHPYLLFRGQDIKDLHVHEKTEQPPATSIDDGAPKVKEPEVAQKPVAPATKQAKTEAARPKQDTMRKERRPTRNNGTSAQVGTGASLLNRKARGTVDGGLKGTPDDDFDFQSSLANFQKEDDASSDEEEVEEAGGSSAYAKDDFFDSISCDALDKQNGVNNRLRGSEERSLNTETFGATALDGQRRRRYGGRGGRGRGRGGRGGRGGGGRGPRPQNNRWNQGPPSDSRQRSSTQSGVSS